MADEFVLPPAAPVTPRSVDAGRGLAWLTEAWRLFAQSPGVWILVVLILFAMLVVIEGLVDSRGEGREHDHHVGRGLRLSPP